MSEALVDTAEANKRKFCVVAPRRAHSIRLRPAVLKCASKSHSGAA